MATSFRGPNPLSIQPKLKLAISPPLATISCTSCASCDDRFFDPFNPAYPFASPRPQYIMDSYYMAATHSLRSDRGSRRSRDQRPLRLLSLDGGGVRGFSTLLLIQVPSDSLVRKKRARPRIMVF